MQYFASLQEFEIFEEFNGVPGTYIKSFLISDKINLNNWQATHEANITNIDDAIGRPGILYVNPENGKLDHTGATTKKKSLQIQELYRVANIIGTGCDIATRKCWEFSRIINDEVADKIRKKIIRFISPSIWPEEDSVEQIEQTDGRTIDVVHDYDWLHYAFVDEPAFGPESEIKILCDGTTKECIDEARKFDASIDNVAPLTENEIIIKKLMKNELVAALPDNVQQCLQKKLPDDLTEGEQPTDQQLAIKISECKKQMKSKNSSKNWLNTSNKKNSGSKTQMGTEEELRKDLEDAKKAQDEIKQELEDMKSKKAIEEEELEKEKEAKKGQDEEKEDEDDPKTVALKARIEVLENNRKSDLINNLVSAQLSASIISKSDEAKLRTSLSAASIEDLESKVEIIKPFVAKLKANAHTESATVPYMGSVNADTEGDYGSLDASVDDMDFDKIMEVSN